MLSPGFIERHEGILAAFDSIVSVEFDDDLKDKAFLCLNFPELGRNTNVQENDQNTIKFMNNIVKEKFEHLPLSDDDKTLLKDAYTQSRTVTAVIDKMMFGFD